MQPSISQNRPRVSIKTLRLILAPPLAFLFAASTTAALVQAHLALSVWSVMTQLGVSMFVSGTSI